MPEKPNTSLRQVKTSKQLLQMSNIPQYNSNVQNQTQWQNLKLLIIH